MQIVYLFLLFLSLLSSCGTPPPPMPKKQIQAETIFRKDQDRLFQLDSPQHTSPELLACQARFAGKYPTITKEFFRCKGNSLNPAIVKERDGKATQHFRDCAAHGLPMREGQEFIYPCLIELLNYIQTKTGHKVVITSGHRCPEHNLYVNNAPANFSSKHLLGAEVDFYVEGLTNEPLKVIELLQTYYRDTFPYKSHDDYVTFVRYDSSPLQTKPWYNKEIFIKLNLAHEGRDFDNQHSYPYISLQVRYDRKKEQKVVFDEKQTRQYLRH